MTLTPKINTLNQVTHYDSNLEPNKDIYAYKLMLYLGIICDLL